MNGQVPCVTTAIFFRTVRTNPVTKRAISNVPLPTNREKLTDLIRQNGTNRTRSSHVAAVIEPVFSSEPLIAYRYAHNLAQHEAIILTIKTTMQFEKNDHQAELMKRPNLGVFGREAARPYILGIVAAFSLAYDRFDWRLGRGEMGFFRR